MYGKEASCCKSSQAGDAGWQSYRSVLCVAEHVDYAHCMSSDILSSIISIQSQADACSLHKQCIQAINGAQHSTSEHGTKCSTGSQRNVTKQQQLMTLSLLRLLKLSNCIYCRCVCYSRGKQQSWQWRYSSSSTCCRVHCRC